jgi:formamidopyrimidine-DNA glycosylase
MPELPDLTVYVERLNALAAGSTIQAVAVPNPFVVRSVDPPITRAAGKRVTSAGRIGKRIVLSLDGDLFLVIHLMIAGRLRWRVPPATISGRRVLAAFTFPIGVLYLTEAGTTRRASLHLVRGRDALQAFDRGGLEVFAMDRASFTARLRSANHTLKRALTDPGMLSGIGNAYSDEILHRARLSPLTLTSALGDDAFDRLFDATRATLDDWTRRLRAMAGDAFPETVTAFRDGMAVHGRFGLPCPACGRPVQRIRYADNETNYCPHCQTGGRLLADRALSRLLRKDWPRSLDEFDGTDGMPGARRSPPRRRR